MTTVGEFINAVVPYVILVVAVFLLYRPLKEPLKGLWGLISGAFGWINEKKEDTKELFKSKNKEIEFQ